MTRLSVNINKIAWLRNAREGDIPDLVQLGRLVLEAGAHGLTIHPRPDQRHIRAADVLPLRELAAEFEGVEFNIEGNPTAGERDNGYPGFLDLVESARPEQCTLVPDSDSQLTSDHGWDLLNDETNAQVHTHVKHYQDLGVRVSIFIDPVIQQIERAALTGADRIELYTGPWVECVNLQGIASDIATERLQRYHEAAKYAAEQGLGVNAGHDLNRHNLATFCDKGLIDEVSIGHALIADALELGLQATVRRYLECLPQGGLSPTQSSI